MYLLWRDHHLSPSAYLNLPEGEKVVLRAFAMKESAPKVLQQVCWKIERERLDREEE